MNDQHNHATILTDFHSAQRKIAMTAEIRNDVSRQLQIQIKSAEIFTSLRILEFTLSANLDDSKYDFENSIIISLFKSRDIYNLKTKLRRESLKSLISSQALIRELKQKD